MKLFTKKTILRWLSNRRLMLLIIILTLGVRLFLMWLLPLTDNTEARYGEIARLTAQNGFWLMPHVNLGTAFFAKPPLSSWLNALSILLLGANEFSARLPALILSVLSLAFTWRLSKDLGLKKPLFIVLAACISPMFFICAGAVMTDATQMCVVTLGMLAAWRIFFLHIPVSERSVAKIQFWQWIFWINIALAALTKGLATWVLIGLPLVIFGLLEGKSLQLWKQLFHLPAVITCLCIFSSWYWLANHHYPGFLNYFIIGEHFSRFLIPGWNGDRYGSAHKVPWGMIWIFWLVAILPWIGVFIVEIKHLAHNILRQRFSLNPTLFDSTNSCLQSDQVSGIPTPHHKRLKLYLWCFVLVPLAFFSLARNIIAPYTLTAITPFVLLAGVWFERKKHTTQRKIILSTAIFPIAILMVTPYLWKKMNLISDKNLIATYQRQPEYANQGLIYATQPAYSSNFYTQEHINYEPNWQTAQEPLIVIKQEEWQNRPQQTLHQFVEITHNNAHVLVRNLNAQHI